MNLEKHSSKLAIGTAQFGSDYGISNESGMVPLAKIEEILKTAESCNIKTIDTAISYGEAEKSLGMIGVDNFNVITKLPKITPVGSDIEKYVIKTVKNSLDNLKTSQLHAVLLHTSNDLIGKYSKKIYKALYKLKEEGLTNKIGVSVYNPDETFSICQEYDLDMVQLPLNIFDQRFRSGKCIEFLSSRGIDVHVRSVFLQGLLLMRRENLPTKFNRWMESWNIWHDWLEKTKIDAVSACLNAISEDPNVDSIVVGIESKQQLVEIINAETKRIGIQVPDFNLKSELLLNPSNWSSL